MAKTGITEASIFVALYGAVEAAQSFMLENPVIPEPWGGLALGIVGVGLYFIRKKMKTAE